MEPQASALSQAGTSLGNRTLTSNTTSAAVREQLIQALALDLVGPTPSVLAQLEAIGLDEEASQLREEMLDRPPTGGTRAVS